MSSFYLALLPVVAAALVGCASMKQELTSEGYKNISEMRAITHMCGVAGLMSPETAALGQDFAQRAFNNHQVDAARLAQDTQRVASNRRNATSENCNEWSMMILGVKNRAEARSGSSTQPYMPRSTTCNTAFGQTHCTSY